MKTSTSVPKVYPTQNLGQLRNISGLFEKLLAELIISAKLDPAQYGNQKGMSIQHYLIKMVHRVLEVLDFDQDRNIIASYCFSGTLANLLESNEQSFFEPKMY